MKNPCSRRSSCKAKLSACTTGVPNTTLLVLCWCWSGPSRENCLCQTGRGQAGRTACVRFVPGMGLLVSIWWWWIAGPWPGNGRWGNCLFCGGGRRPLDNGETGHWPNCLFSVGGRRPLDTVKLDIGGGRWALLVAAWLNPHAADPPQTACSIFGSAPPAAGPG